MIPGRKAASLRIVVVATAGYAQPQPLSRGIRPRPAAPESLPTVLRCRTPYPRRGFPSNSTSVSVGNIDRQGRALDGLFRLLEGRCEQQSAAVAEGDA